MDDFYKQIRESLNDLPEPGFRKKDWRAMSAELDSRKLSPALFWGWLAAPVLLSLALMAGWHYGLEPLNGSGPMSTLTDTVYITQTIRQLDTVYIEKAIPPRTDLAKSTTADAAQMRQMQREINILRGQLSMLLPETPPAGRLGSVSPTAPGAEPAAGLPYPTFTNVVNIGTATRLTDVPVDASAQIGYARLGSPPTAGLPLRQAGLATGTGNKSRLALRMDWLVDEIREVDMNPLQLGAFTGLFYPSSGRGDHRIGKMVGIQALMPLTSHFQAESNLMYQNGAYETMDLGETGKPLPVAEGEDLRFLKVEAPYKSIQWDIGLKYVFKTGGQF
jgi:hypothetical protein